MSVSASSVNTLCDAAQTAIGTGDYSTARTKLEQALASLAGLPDGGAYDRSLRFDRQAVLGLLDYVNKRIVGTQSVTRTPVKYVRATS